MIYVSNQLHININKYQPTIHIIASGEARNGRQGGWWPFFFLTPSLPSSMVSKILEGLWGGSMEFWAVGGLEPPQPPLDPPLAIAVYSGSYSGRFKTLSFNQLLIKFVYLSYKNCMDRFIFEISFNISGTCFWFHAGFRRLQPAVAAFDRFTGRAFDTV